MKNRERKEKKLLDDLETMYQRVAESENPAADRKQMEALKGYYEALQVSPDASLEKIKETYERLVDFWNPSQFADNPSLQQEAEKKLPEITRAYEKILAFRQKQGGPASAEPPMEISEEPDLSVPVEETGHHFPRGKILLGGAALVVVVLAGLFWPTLYHYDTIQSGNRAYQVRTNRITGSMTYLDGGKWNNPPIPVAKPSAPPALPAPPLPAQPPALSEKEPIPTPTTKPGPAEEPEVAIKREAPSEKQASRPAETKGYAIQVSAMRDLNLAKEFVETQKKSGQPVYLAKIRAKDRGMWYRIYIGHFADEAEAARYMKEKKIKEFFPECFIQKLS
ncbi:MAG: SPOR domain-containing protein [Thermodesulfobacteriota bacterium]|jgi:cell division septation protein DedD